MRMHRTPRSSGSSWTTFCLTCADCSRNSVHAWCPCVEVGHGGKLSLHAAKAVSSSRACLATSAKPAWNSREGSVCIHRGKWGCGDVNQLHPSLPNGGGKTHCIAECAASGRDHDRGSGDAPIPQLCQELVDLPPCFQWFPSCKAAFAGQTPTSGVKCFSVFLQELILKCTLVNPNDAIGFGAPKNFKPVEVRRGWTIHGQRSIKKGCDGAAF